MASLFKFANLEKDYVEFEKNLFKTNEFKFEITTELKPHFKKYYRCVYCIALFETKLFAEHKEEGSKYLFLSEILSDLLCNSTISMLGFYHSSQILMRRMTENFYNHIFYFDHPVEFELLNLGKNEYTPIHELKKYFESHPIIRKYSDENIKNFNESLFNYYHELCRTVHTKGQDFMGLAQNLEETKPDINIESHFEAKNKSLLWIIYLLYKFHFGVKFTHVEKNILSTTFIPSV